MRLKNIIGLVIAALIIVGSIVFSLWGDWLWFGSTGYQNVFTTVLFSGLGIGALFGSGFLVFGLANLFLAKKLSIKGKKKPPKDVGKALILIILFFSLMVGLTFSSWEVVLKYLNPAPFGIADPVFGLDIGFYAFQLPFLGYLLAFLGTMIVLATIITVLSYAGYLKLFDIKPRQRIELEVESVQVNMPSFTVNFEKFKDKATHHISGLIGLLFFVIGGSIWLSRYSLLLSGGGAVYGAGYTDMAVSIPFITVLTVVSVAIGILFLVNMKVQSWGIITKGIAAFIIISIIGSVAAGAVQGLVVGPDEFNLEKPYIEYNIQSTLAAYGLDRVTESEFPVSYDLNMEDIQENSATIDNIRLWDWRPLRKTYDQLQLFRTYYDFYDVDIDRYQIDGMYKQVMVSAREMNTGDLPSGARTWVNEHLVYTHGHGVVMIPVDKVSGEGLPEFYVKDIPAKASYQSLEIDRPEIYFGEETDTYAIVKTTTEELDYPSGDQNIYTTYKGDNGVPLSDLFTRLVYAVKFRSVEMLFSGSIKPESKLLMYRDIRDRASTIAPFLNYDQDPYIIISDGKLYWMIDAYTTTDMYPYSEHIYSDWDSFNYIRNSVKVVVDAYSGEVNYYVIDQSDPMIQVYGKIFPGMFKDFQDMPEGLKAHIRYPDDLFNIQIAMYSYYHMKEARVFYNKEDVWVTPNEIYRKSKERMMPYFVILKIPGEDSPEFISMMPFTPRGKQNLIGWMAAKSDDPGYGDLLVYTFSKQELIYGPMQIEARIDQDTDISQLITLWDQSGSSVIRGNTLVIPIEDSILYIEPLYLEAVEAGTLPQLKRVIAAYGDRLTMQESLDEALSVLFGAAPSGPGVTIPSDMTSDEALAEITRVYNLAQDSLKAGDLAGYAEYMAQIGNLLA